MSADVPAVNPCKTLVVAASFVAVAGFAAMNPVAAGKRELMIVGLDEKQSWDASGKAVIGPPGRDSVAIIDVGADPLAPKILVALPLMNTIVGPPVTHVVFTPDGRRALAGKFPGHKIAFLEVNGEKVTYNKQDVPAGLWPYNVDVTPDGKLALTADNGNSGAADGHVDTVSVIDIEANPPRVIDKVVVGDAPEGFAISPTGRLAVAGLLRGTTASKSAFFYNRNALVVARKTDGKKATRANEVEGRGLPEGVAFGGGGLSFDVGSIMEQD